LKGYDPGGQRMHWQLESPLRLLCYNSSSSLLQLQQKLQLLLPGDIVAGVLLATFGHISDNDETAECASCLMAHST